MHNFVGEFMDIMLKRILSLIPKKENGKYVHGAKKEFCDSIGAPPNIINEWERGVSKSYRNYLYQIAEKYNVSVEWLKGETDERNPAPKTEDGITEKDIRVLNWFNSLPPETRKAILTLGGGPEDLGE